jgi:hypothetical protein
MLNGLKTSLFYILCGSCRFRLAMSPTTPLEVIFLAMKDILWFEWLYAVTHEWRIWSYPKYRSKKWKFLKNVPDPQWYLHLGLSVKWNKKMLSVHRAVAQAFIPNPDNKPQVNHIDWNPSNNHVSNLEWCTCYENQAHSINILGKKTWLQFEKRISQHNKDWSLVKVWESQRIASRELWFNQSNISKCCLWTRETAHWFRWSFKTERFNLINKRSQWN